MTARGVPAHPTAGEAGPGASGWRARPASPEGRQRRRGPSGGRGRARVAAWHRWLGVLLTLPLLGWMASAVAMTLATADAPNGLNGTYALRPYNSVDVPLESAVLSPAAALRRAATLGVSRVYWLRLEARGAHLWYVVKPAPFAPAHVFDARTGARLDPLPDSLLAIVASEALEGSRVTTVADAPEANRYYAAPRVPAVAARVAGRQPATLILSRDEGRTLRRADARAARFEWWYRTFHVQQLGPQLGLWTTLLYAGAVGMMAVVALGASLFWWRRRRPAGAAAPGGRAAPGDRTVSAAGRARPRRWADARALHRGAGVLVGGVLVVQLAVGMYLWLCLGPLEDAFRGKASIATDWRGGFPSDAPLADVRTVLQRVGAASPPTAPADRRPVQAIEWRRLGAEDAWFVTWRRDEPAHGYRAPSGRPLGPIAPAVAGAIARAEVRGHPAFFLVGASPQRAPELNRPLPTYRFRFRDRWRTDVYVAQHNGEVLQRRPRFWRLFDPLLAVHTLALTGVRPLDLGLLTLVQGALLVTLVSGWRLHARFPVPRLGRLAAGRPSRAPTRAVPTRAVPTCAVPTCAVPTCAVPTRAVPTRAVPTRAVPTRAVPTLSTATPRPTARAGRDHGPAVVEREEPILPAVRRRLAPADRTLLVLGVLLPLTAVAWLGWTLGRTVMRDRAVAPGVAPAPVMPGH